MNEIEKLQSESSADLGAEITAAQLQTMIAEHDQHIKELGRICHKTESAIDSLANDLTKCLYELQRLAVEIEKGGSEAAAKEYEKQTQRLEELLKFYRVVRDELDREYDSVIATGDQMVELRLALAKWPGGKELPQA